MIADDGKTPILMDLGSCLPARIHIRTRQEALLQQDIAAEHSSMPYRAPELFDVHTSQTLDEKVDIWSLGCTLFALAYSYSPFEDPSNAGGSISMAVASGSYRHSRARGAKEAYSEGFRGLVDGCLVVRKEERWGIDKVRLRICSVLLSGSFETHGERTWGRLRFRSETLTIDACFDSLSPLLSAQLIEMTEQCLANLG